LVLVPVAWPDLGVHPVAVPHRPAAVGPLAPGRGGGGGRDCGDDGAGRPAAAIRLQNEDYTVRNPIGLAGVPDPEEGVLGAVLSGLLFGCMAAAVASVVLRFRRSRGVERQQLKWFTYAAALLAVSFLLWGFLLPAGG
jgi:hypothetical protein